jgi:hypothetical protein
MISSHAGGLPRWLTIGELNSSFGANTIVAPVAAKIRLAGLPLAME